MGDFASFLGRMAGVAGSGALGGLWEGAQEYFGSLASAAAEKWAVDIALGTGCHYCDRRSFGRCEKCGSPACLFHGRPSAEANVICEACVDEACGRPRQEGKRRRRGRGRQALDPERAAALAVLELDETATWEQVQARFREMTAKLHPDKFKDPVQKKQADEKFKQVTVAYEVLKRRAAA